ncbi:MAG TPA: MBOAT family protein [Chitinophagaceae bacterium]|nr:MBOAT family protein [Chitinophagaceae bacterium]
MLFNSYAFIIFFGVVLLLHYMRFTWKVKKINLLVASYLFYAVWNPPFVLLLWLSTLLDFFLGKKMYAEQNPIKRKSLLMASLVVNLGMLAFFKYGSFLSENFVTLVALIGVDFHPVAPDIILPVGISFYTFQTLSYSIDMYKKRSLPEKSLLDFSLYVTFFPQLVAGPIVRPAELMPQFKKPHQANRQQFIRGLMLVSLGLFMKVVMADTLLSGVADMVFGAKQALLSVDAWLGVLAFSGQIFFDFAGYSTCAIGVAACLGFTLPDNFRYPYAAIGFSDFWRRWHISLSTWLRDYLYIPLGGNRNGTMRTYLNLMITMLLGGLWHGASWTFVVWGALHGIYLSVERMLRGNDAPHPPKFKSSSRILLVPKKERLVTESASLAPAFLRGNRMHQFFGAMLTFLLVNITWVFFRASDFGTAWNVLGSMFRLAENGVALVPTIDMVKVVVVTIFLLATHWAMRNTTVMQVAQKAKWWVTGSVWALMLILIVLSQKSSDSFIYFQF